ncbi:MAG: hypothetical protein EOP86_16710 [Verrucomicrobiaceae bacterium]|nr:MAG: hypothetical protein EOP86_16710 [Verrucomicrobiaceae bacterium]
MMNPVAPRIRRAGRVPWLPAMAAAVLAWLLLAAGTARAHPMLQNPLWIEITPQHLTIKLQVSVRELCVVQGVPITLDGTVDEAQAEDAAPRHSPYLLDHLDLRADGNSLTGKVLGIDPPPVIKQGGEDGNSFTMVCDSVNRAGGADGKEYSSR